MTRRILLLITDLKVGGTPSVVRELALRLREPGRVEIEVACLAPWGPVADVLQGAGVAVTALGAGSAAALPLVVPRLVRLIRRRQFDTVFSFLVHANTVAALASPWCAGVRFLHSVQTTQPRPRWHWQVQRAIWPAADRVVVPSPSAAAAAAEWAGVPHEHIVVIPNAVDVDHFVPVATDRGAPSPPFHIGFLGRLDPVKRIPDLLRAMVSVPREIAVLDVFGEGAEQARLMRLITELGLSGSVTLHGHVNDPAHALRRIDLLVLPSEAEGFGLVLIEAMAACVPVVATDVPGIRDVVQHGENGILVPPRAPDALRNAILNVLQSPALHTRLAQQGRAAVVARYGWPKVLEQYRQLLGIDDRVPVMR